MMSLCPESVAAEIIRTLKVLVKVCPNVSDMLTLN